MDVDAIDHVNLRIPKDRIEAAITFYVEILGFEIENRKEYETGERSFFSFRLSDTNVIHVMPTEDFKEPDGHNYDHLALRVEESVDTLKQKFHDADIKIKRELEPRGATGIAPAIYVKDPFGYLLELKETN